MRILITGGNGFAGKYLVDYFSRKGHDIVATYRSNLPVIKNDRIKYFKQELSEDIVLDQDVDLIIHTACSRSGKELSIEEYVKDNIEPAKKIVQFAREKGIKNIVYFSTRSVYGQIRHFEVKEEDDIINPDKYGLTKRIAELIFSEADDINTIGFRLPGIIGPEAHDIWLVRLVEKMMREEEVEISDFETRNLVHIDDIARFIEKIAVESSLEADAKFKYSVVNLACKETINNIEIANIIKKRLKSGSKILVREAAPDLFWLNPSKALEMGWEPSAPSEIVNKYMDWMCSSSLFFMGG